MIIAVMSDLHDNLTCWGIMVRQLNEQKISILINCGDTVAPATLKEMSQTFNGTIHTVFGNNADRELELQVAPTLLNIMHHGDQGAIHVDGKCIGFTHIPQIATAMAQTGEFQIVCHGHTHLKRWEPFDRLATTNRCMLLNPGPAGGQRAYPSYALLDLAAMKVQFVEITL